MLTESGFTECLDNAKVEAHNKRYMYVPIAFVTLRTERRYMYSPLSVFFRIVKAHTSC